MMGALGIAAVGIPASYYFLSDIEYDPLTATPASLSLIWDDATIVDIGRKYLSQVPSESGTRTLVACWRLKIKKLEMNCNCLWKPKSKATLMAPGLSLLMGGSSVQQKPVSARCFQ